MPDRSNVSPPVPPVAHSALKTVAERHPECDTPDAVLVVYPEVVGHQAIAECALPASLQPRGYRVLRQALSRQEREWQVHPVRKSEMAQAYLQTIQSVCAQLIANAHRTPNA